MRFGLMRPVREVGAASVPSSCSGIIHVPGLDKARDGPFGWGPSAQLLLQKTSQQRPISTGKTLLSLYLSVCVESIYFLVVPALLASAAAISARNLAAFSGSFSAS